MTKLILATLAVVLASSVNANAITDHRYDTQGVSQSSYKPYRSYSQPRQYRSRARYHRTKYTKRTKHTRYASYRSRGEVKYMPHPEGCPRRAFCGCGTSLHVFGKVVRYGGLAIAANWLSFPRAEPGPGMVAARRGHVFAILENRGRGTVLAYDPNSGGHRTRIHLRSLRGYTVVDPKGGSKYAEAK